MFLRSIPGRQTAGTLLPRHLSPRADPSDFICQLSRKYDIQPDRIVSSVSSISSRTIYVVVIDDDVDGEIAEGQDMLARLTEVSAQFASGRTIQRDITMAMRSSWFF